MRKLLILLVTGVTLKAHAQKVFNAREIYDQGYQYIQGLHKPYDPEKAMGLFLESAEKGYSRAMNAIGNMYLEGIAVPVNVDSAEYWYERAGKKGYAVAWKNLGRMYQLDASVPQDFKRSAEYFRKGSEAGDLNSRNMLAYYHFKGLGLPQDYNAAFRIFSEVAAKGHTNAQYFLGICYRNGYGTPVDTEKAKYWLQKAASSNEKQSFHELSRELMPENKSAVTGDFQRNVDVLKRHYEQFENASTNNLSGTYNGHAIYYDFSGKHVADIVPLSLMISKKDGGYFVKWQEGDSLNATLNADVSKKQLLFDKNSTYTRNNYYSYRTEEKLRFENAELDIKYLNDSMYLSGYVNFYSLKRKEPTQPMFIALSRAFTEDEKNRAGLSLSLDLAPNPATTTIRAQLKISKISTVRLQLLTQTGVVLKQVDPRRLPEGSYNINFDLQGLTPGTYMVRVTEASGISKTMLFIKN